MIQIPKIGLGTWLVPDNEVAATVRTCGIPREYVKSNLDVNFEISEGDMDILKTF